MTDFNIDNPQANQVLVWSDIEQAFVNITPNATALNIDIPQYTVTPLSNTGYHVVSGFSGNTLQARTLEAGQNVSLTQSGGSITIAVDTLDAATLNGYSDTDFLKVSNQLSEIETAPLLTRLNVYTKDESHDEFMETNASNIPDADNAYDLGSNGRRYADIYAKTFHGTATYALVAGSVINKGAVEGDILIWRQSQNDWVPENVLDQYLKKEGLQILPQYGERMHIPASPSFDVAVSNVFYYEFDDLESGTVEFMAPTDGNLYSITVILKNSDNAGFEWPSYLKWIGLNQEPDRTPHDILTFFTIDGVQWFGTYAGSVE